MTTENIDAVVVGSGPNGMAAAVTLARAGLEVVVYEEQEHIGGGARTLDLGLTDAGVMHDLCSAVHPLALASPFFTEFDILSRGVEIRIPEVSYAQPLDDMPAGVAWHDLERTIAELPGTEGRDWRRLMGPLVAHQEIVTDLALSDKRSLPRSVLSRRGAVAALHFAKSLLSQGSRLWDAALPGRTSAALLTGVGAHAVAPMPSLGSAATALLLGTLAHSVGWGLPVGGSQAIINAMVEDLELHGGRVIPGHRIETWSQLPRARAYIFDTTPRALVEIWGERMPARAARALRRFPYGAAAAKVDFVISEPVPWNDERLSLAGTVHVAGDRADMVRAEGRVNRGQHADSPMVLLSEPARVVGSRQVGTLRPLWTYAHVPADSSRDVTEDIIRQIERFAPDFRDVIVASRAITANQMSRHNANYIGGDFAAGMINAYRMLARPTPWINPYSGAIPGVYLSSSSTPPGPGVHGMSGWYAAVRALKQRFGVSQPPALGPNVPL